MKIKGIVACDKNGLIGNNGALPWRVPEDLKFFKEMTYGKTVVMGRKTWESLGSKPLPGRRNIVLSRSLDYTDNIARSVDDILKLHADEVWIIGGAEIYNLFIPYYDEFYWSEIHGDFKGDVYLPDSLKIPANAELINEIPGKVKWFLLNKIK
ncbi:MAG TPA: dihydrofolate reductase [Bacilli bacterium]